MRGREDIDTKIAPFRVGEGFLQGLGEASWLADLGVVGRERGRLKAVLTTKGQL